MTDARQQLRKELRRQRRQLSAAEQQQAAHSLCRLLSSQPIFRNSRHIACYLSNDGEIDLSPLMRKAWQLGKQIYLPVLNLRFHKRLWFAAYRDGDPLQPNRFGIPEPVVPFGQLRHPMQLDLVLTPLVAFDGQGNRLGMGGGFYDRSFAFLHHRNHWRRPHLLGTAHHFQQCTQPLPAQSWDVPLSGISTDREILLTPRVNASN